MTRKITYKQNKDKLQNQTRFTMTDTPRLTRSCKRPIAPPAPIRIVSKAVFDSMEEQAKQQEEQQARERAEQKTKERAEREAGQDEEEEASVNSFMQIQRQMEAQTFMHMVDPPLRIDSGYQEQTGHASTKKKLPYPDDDDDDDMKVEMPMGWK